MGHTIKKGLFRQGAKKRDRDSGYVAVEDIKIVDVIAIPPLPLTLPRFENSQNVEMQNRHEALGNGREWGVLT